MLLNDKQRITHCDEKRIIHTEQAANNTLGLYPFTTWAEEIKEGIFFFFYILNCTIRTGVVNGAGYVNLSARII